MKIALLLVLIRLCADASDLWPQFRGPGATGVAEQQGLPDSWGPDRNVAWRTPIAGDGWSSPVVAGGPIFVTSVISAKSKEAPKPGLYFGGERPAPDAEHRWVVWAIDFDLGRVLWQTEVHRGVPGFSHHLKNTFASETPVTDGEHVYAYFGNVGLFCLDMAGKVVWSRSWGPYKTYNGWGTAASPVLDGERLYVQNDNEEESFLAALDKRTGKEIWRAKRDERTTWATPYVWKHARRIEIVTAGARRIRSYDLDGKQLWELSGMSSLAVPTPFAGAGLLYVSSGYVGDQVRPAYAIRPGAKGDITPAPDKTSNGFVAWSLPQGGPYMPSPLVYGGYYYTLYDRGFLTCHDAESGREVYGKVRIGDAPVGFTASPWAYGGKIFALSEDGDTYVIRAGPEYELLGKNSLGEFSMATPAIARGSLILRTASHLYRIGRP